MAVIDVVQRIPREVFNANGGDTLRIQVSSGPDSLNNPGSCEVHPQGGQNFGISAVLKNEAGATVAGPVGPTATAKVTFNHQPPMSKLFYEVSIPADSNVPDGAGFESNYVQPMARPGH